MPAYESHLSQEAVQREVAAGDVHVGVLRVNSTRPREAYVKVDAYVRDVYVCGVKYRNRALNGDTVAVHVSGRNVCGAGNDASADDDTGCGSASSDANAPSVADTCDAVSSPPSSSSPPADATDSSGLAARVERLRLSDSSATRAAVTAQPRGKVVAIVERVQQRCICGVVRAAREQGEQRTIGEDDRLVRIVPDDARLPGFILPAEQLPSALRAKLRRGRGDDVIVSVKFRSWTETHHLPQCRFHKLIGRAGDIEAETARIMLRYGIRPVEAADELPAAKPGRAGVGPDPASIATAVASGERRDLRRSHRIFSIDPATARDLDDALSVRRRADGTFSVGVHIADVTHYVPAGSQLDRVAAERATTFYLVQRALPMLPPELSELACSLQPGVDRYAVSLEFTLDARGEPVCAPWMGRTVIRSRAKLSYDAAQRVISSGGKTDTARIRQEAGEEEEEDVEKADDDDDDDLSDDILMLHRLATARRRARFARGALRLESVKLKFELDEASGEPREARRETQREANWLVEEFMLLANMSVARFIADALPERAVLRRHPEPDANMLQMLSEQWAKLGVELDVSSAGALHASVQRVGDARLRELLMAMLARPMRNAVYFCTGALRDEPCKWRHYALSVSHYTHFTSPIRRYADVLVHRQLLAALRARAHADADVDADADADDNGARTNVDNVRALEAQCQRCNDRKTAADNAQQESAALFFAALLRKEPRFMDGLVARLAEKRDYAVVYVPQAGQKFQVNFRDELCASCVDSDSDDEDKNGAVLLSWSEADLRRLRTAGKCKLVRTDTAVGADGADAARPLRPLVVSSVRERRERAGGTSSNVVAVASVRALDACDVFATGVVDAKLRVALSLCVRVEL